MDKKLIFLDLDGTIISHKTNSIPNSTVKAIKLLKKNGHTVIIATGRPPSLFYGIDKELEIDSYVAANGRIAVYEGKLVLDKPIDHEIVKSFEEYATLNNIDIAFEGINDYVLNSDNSGLSNQFSDVFHLHYPEVVKEFHLHNNVYQIIMFYTKDDFKTFETMFPSLNFSFANNYGIDVNAKGGLKDVGVKALVNHLNFDLKDTIAVGDGFNDISMIEYCNIGIAMGNAAIKVQESADIVTDRVEEDGLYNVFLKLGLI
jgi:Cof subfamily protein (haloacid dehalogenase superfamily)